MCIPTETHAFLETLYAHSTGYLTLSALPPNRQQPTPSRHIPLNHPAALEVALADLWAANRQGWSAVFSVATRRTDLGRWRRGGLGELDGLPALFVDIDAPAAQAWARVRGYDPPPSCGVHSGYGLHVYWWLDMPTSDWARAAQVLRGLQGVLGADANGLTAALRLPGSHNPKAGRGRCHVELLTSTRYRLADFAVPLPVPARRQARQPPTRTPSARLNPALLAAVTARLLADDGYWQRNGWLAARCPCGHTRDAAGQHFAFDPARGVGVCLGRHGRLLLKDICWHLNLHPQDYGGIYA